MFKGRSKFIPLPPPAAEPEPETSPLADEVIADMAMEAAEVAEANADRTLEVATTEPAPEPEPAPPEPIPGLRVGLHVLTVSNHEARPGIVTKIHDACTGDCHVYVFEPVAPCRSERLTYAGDGTDASHGTWTWSGRGG